MVFDAGFGGEDAGVDLTAAVTLLMHSGVVGVLAGEGDLITLANDRFLEMVGYTRADLEGDGIDWVALTPPEWAAQDVSGVEVIKQRGHAGPLRKEYVHSDGHRVPVMIGGVLLSAEPFRWCSVVVDLTSEAEARRSADAIDALWESVTSALPIGLAVFDRDGRFVHVNPALAAINRRDIDAHLGHRVDELIPPPHGAELRALIDEVFTTGRRVDRPRYVTTDWRTGAIATSLVSYFPVLDTDGAIAAVACAVLDLTDQVALEHRLLTEQRRRQALIDGLFSFVGYLDPDGVLQDANRTALDAAGLDPGDVIGRPFPDTYWWSHDPTVQDRLRTAIDDGRAGIVARYDDDIRLKDGHLITIDFQLVPVVEQDRVVGMVVSGMDVTERFAALRRAAALTDLGRALARAATFDDVAAQAVGPQARSATEAVWLRLWRIGSAGRTTLLASSADDSSQTHPSSVVLETHRTGVATMEGVTDVAAGPHGSTACAMAFPIVYGGGDAILEGVWRQPTDVGNVLLRAQIATGAELIGQALNRAAVSAVRDDLIRELQHQALGDTVDVDGLVIAVRYLPATDELGFGGDWYDILDLDADRIAIVVGDVVGHNASAAAAMSRIRGMFHGALHSRPADDVGDLLADVSHYLTGRNPGYIATVAVAIIDLVTRTLTVLSAGHPPCLVVRPDGSSNFAVEARTSPLGMAAPLGDIPSTQLASGDMIVMYTDGLIESRHQSFDSGLVALRTVVERSANLDVEDVADRIIESLKAADDPQRDDTVLVVITIPDH